MKRYPFLSVLIVLTWLVTLGAAAQEFAKDRWHQGEANLFNGEVYAGQVKFDLENNSLQISQSGTIRSFSAFQVESFSLVDEQTKLVRTFYALPYERADNYETPTFFELLSDGETASLLNREVVVQRVVNQGVAGGWGWGWGMRPMGVTVPVLENRLFLLDKEKSKVIKLNDKKGDLFEHLPSYRAEVEAYAKSKRLDPARLDHAVQLMEYYHTLTKRSN
ncbi:MAG: hypothetical protein MUC97_18070 [Bernardetiaceae bacterium]|jgi:hypothetical protein|nr:hypothetical protein [Bernardetiaceae bacterium]